MHRSFGTKQAHSRNGQRLADRAAAIGRPGLQRVSTMDADLRLLADRHSVKPVFSGNDRVIFVLPRGAREVRLLSRAQSPTEARPWLEDRRRLGVRVKRIVLRGGDELREVPVDHPDLTRGWWAVERDGQIMSRWTDGEAVLPLPEMRGIVMLEIHLAGSMIYAVDAAREDGTDRRAAAWTLRMRHDGCGGRAGAARAADRHRGRRATSWPVRRIVVDRLIVGEEVFLTPVAQKVKRKAALSNLPLTIHVLPEWSVVIQVCLHQFAQPAVGGVIAA